MGYQSATMGAFHSVSRSLLAIQGLKRLDRGADERAKAMKREETLRKDYRAQNELAKKYRESGKIEKAKAAAAQAKKLRGQSISNAVAFLNEKEG